MVYNNIKKYINRNNQNLQMDLQYNWKKSNKKMKH